MAFLLLRIFMFIKYLIFIIVMAVGMSQAMELGSGSYIYRQAKHEDVERIVDFINNQVVLEVDKVVVLPPGCRERVVRSTIEKKRFFIAEHKQSAALVGLQKFFVIDDKVELNDVLLNEIRCKDSVSSAAGYLKLQECDRYCPLTNSIIHYADNDTYLYYGGAFTEPKHRGKGVNTGLNDFAFSEIGKTIINHSKEEQSQKLVMLYGLVTANAGDAHDLLGGRSKMRVNSFINFIEGNYKGGSEGLLLYRYPAFMPKFDQTAQECIPLSDEESVPGFGCVALYDIKS
jgi:hypothetical protein